MTNWNWDNIEFKYTTGDRYANSWTSDSVDLYKITEFINRYIYIPPKHEKIKKPPVNNTEIEEI